MVGHEHARAEAPDPSKAESENKDYSPYEQTLLEAWRQVEAAKSDQSQESPEGGAVVIDLDWARKERDSLNPAETGLRNKRELHLEVAREFKQSPEYIAYEAAEQRKRQAEAALNQSPEWQKYDQLNRLYHGGVISPEVTAAKQQLDEKFEPAAEAEASARREHGDRIEYRVRPAELDQLIEQLPETQVYRQAQSSYDELLEEHRKSLRESVDLAGLAVDQTPEWRNLQAAKAELIQAKAALKPMIRTYEDFVHQGLDQFYLDDDIYNLSDH